MMRRPHSCEEGEAAGSQHENPTRTSNQPQKVLLVLGSLLAAALIVIYRLCFAVLTTNPAPKEERKPFSDETHGACWELQGESWYYFSNYTSSWNQSRDSCQDLGGDLVKIDSREEQMFLGRRASSLMEEEDDRFWIGLTDSEEEGRWLWVDGSPLETSFWSIREPDNRSKDGAPEANCVRMGERGRADHLDSWFDISCYYLQKSICEKAAETERSSRVCG
ncbi:C-type lectin domain family 4 member E-like [Fundulus heteroclitus]|uniref:C-type lectin domain family 4 member E-like n=1 Tax=Fundulus heteroclitus TaxID=8078 RepID=UPI00165C2FBC|nr:C-type lectin domain family 4 member E-like [Fundulus heteroclitus]